MRRGLLLDAVREALAAGLFAGALCAFLFVFAIPNDSWGNTETRTFMLRAAKIPAVTIFALILPIAYWRMRNETKTDGGTPKSSSTRAHRTRSVAYVATVAILLPLAAVGMVHIFAAPKIAVPEWIPLAGVVAALWLLTSEDV